MPTGMAECGSEELSGLIEGALGAALNQHGAADNNPRAAPRANATGSLLASGPLNSAGSILTRAYAQQDAAAAATLARATQTVVSTAQGRRPHPTQPEAPDSGPGDAATAEGFLVKPIQIELLSNGSPDITAISVSPSVITELQSRIDQMMRHPRLKTPPWQHYLPSQAQGSLNGYGLSLYKQAAEASGRGVDDASYNNTRGMLLRSTTRMGAPVTASRLEALAMLTRAFVYSPFAVVLTPRAVRQCLARALVGSLMNDRVVAAVPSVVEDELPYVCALCAATVKRPEQHRWCSGQYGWRVRFCSEGCTVLHFAALSEDLRYYASWPGWASDMVYADYINTYGPDPEPSEHAQHARVRVGDANIVTSRDIDITETVEASHSDIPQCAETMEAEIARVVAPRGRMDVVASAVGVGAARLTPDTLTRLEAECMKRPQELTFDDFLCIRIRHPPAATKMSTLIDRLTGQGRTGVVIGNKYMQAALHVSSTDSRPLVFHVVCTVLTDLAEVDVLTERGVFDMISMAGQFGLMYGSLTRAYNLEPRQWPQALQDAHLAWGALAELVQDFTFYTMTGQGVRGLIDAYLRERLRDAHGGDIMSVMRAVCAECGEIHPFNRTIAKCGSCLSASTCDDEKCRHAHVSKCRLLVKERERARAGDSIMTTLLPQLTTKAATNNKSPTAARKAPTPMKTTQGSHTLGPTPSPVKTSLLAKTPASPTTPPTRPHATPTPTRTPGTGSTRAGRSMGSIFTSCLCITTKTLVWDEDGDGGMAEDPRWGALPDGLRRGPGCTASRAAPKVEVGMVAPERAAAVVVVPETAEESSGEVGEECSPAVHP